MARFPRRLAAVAAVVTLLGGCTVDPHPSAGLSAPSGVAPRPQGVQDPARLPNDAPTPVCEQRGSYRPRGALPAPRQMPGGSTMEQIVKRGRLVVGIDQNAYLLGFREARTGTLAGFEIDVAREVARALFGDPEAIQFRAITTADRLPVLQRKEVDMVVRTMSMTCERWQQIAFSTEYLTSRQRLLVNIGSGIRSLDDLGGRKVCATRGSTTLVAVAQAASKPVPVATESTLDCLVLLQQGQVAAVSTLDTILVGLAAQDPNTEIVGPAVTGDDPAGIGMSRDAVDFVRFVNGVLERMRADGTWKRLYDTWLGRLGPAPAPPAAAYQD